MYFYELSSSSLMEVNKEEIPDMHIMEDEEEISLRKRKIDSNGKSEDEREVKKIAFFTQKPQEEEERTKREEDIDMTEEDTERDDPRDNTDKIMEDTVIEEDYVVDFNGFF